MSKSQCVIFSHSLNSVIAIKVYPAAHAGKPGVVLNFSISLPIQALLIPPAKYLPNPSADLYSQIQQTGPSLQQAPLGGLYPSLPAPTSLKSRAAREDQSHRSDESVLYNLAPGPSHPGVLIVPGMFWVLP